MKKGSRCVSFVVGALPGSATPWDDDLPSLGVSPTGGKSKKLPFSAIYQHLPRRRPRIGKRLANSPRMMGVPGRVREKRLQSDLPARYRSCLIDFRSINASERANAVRSDFIRSARSTITFIINYQVVMLIV